MKENRMKFIEKLKLLIDSNTENSHAIRSQGGDQMLAYLLDENSRILYACLEYINDKKRYMVFPPWL